MMIPQYRRHIHLHYHHRHQQLSNDSYPSHRWSRYHTLEHINITNYRTVVNFQCPITVVAPGSGDYNNHLLSSLSSRGSLLAPTLVHGAGSAVCWLRGVLAARIFEEEAFPLRKTAVSTAEQNGRSSSSSSLSSSSSSILTWLPPISQYSPGYSKMAPSPSVY